MRELIDTIGLIIDAKKQALEPVTRYRTNAIFQEIPILWVKSAGCPLQMA